MGVFHAQKSSPFVISVRILAMLRLIVSIHKLALKLDHRRHSFFTTETTLIMSLVNFVYNWLHQRNFQTFVKKEQRKETSCFNIKSFPTMSV